MAVYTVAQLLNLNRKNPVLFGPAKPDFDYGPKAQLYFRLWKQYNDLLRRGPIVSKPDTRVVMRYSLSESNRSFEKRWIFQHKSITGLKELRRYPVIVHTDHQVRWLKEHVEECESLLRRLDSLRPTVFGQKALSVPKPLEYIAPPKVDKPKVIRKNPITTRVGKIMVDNHGNTIKSYLGGRALTVPPLAHHKKYWYFLRKRGCYTFSEHHPYGDEGRLISLFDSGQTHVKRDISRS